jgi:uncharacterized protein (DUF924 family)
MTPQTILDFWFQESTPEQWFKRDDSFDETIRSRFSKAHRQAALGELDAWTETAIGALSLVILLDQFSRNMFRDASTAFATDAKALAVSRGAIAAGLDKELDAGKRKFLYMPFMHSEDLGVQDEGLKLFGALNDPYTMEFAVQHREVVARFGRFPHRNEALGRISTPEEIEYMRGK